MENDRAPVTQSRTAMPSHKPRNSDLSLHVRVALAGLLFSTSAFAQSTLVKIDVPQLSSLESSSPSPYLTNMTTFISDPPMTGFQGEVFFTASTQATGREIFRTDGTALGTSLLVDTEPGTGSTSGGEMVAGGQGVFYTASTTGPAGTLYFLPGGQAPVVSLGWTASGERIRAPWALTPVGNLLYFTGVTSAFGRELMVTDGTIAGTRLVADLAPGVASSSIGSLIASPVPGEIMFREHTGLADDAWRSDGTQAGTQIIASNSFLEPIRFGAAVIFRSNVNVTGNHHLYSTDGTAAGTMLIADLSGVSPSGFAPDLSESGIHAGVLYFTAGTPGNLYQTMGAPGTTSKVSNDEIVFLEWLGVVNGTLFASVQMNPSQDRELYTVDSSGVSLFADINPAGPSNPRNGQVVGGKLLFSAIGDSAGADLYATDGSAGNIEKLMDVATTDGNAHFHLTPISATHGVFKGAGSDGDLELFITDGTVAGTQLAADINPTIGAVGGVASNLKVVNGSTLYFQVKSEFAQELHKWDAQSGVTSLGPEAPTEPIRTEWLGNHQEIYYFSDTGQGRRLFHTDGTQAGTTTFDLFPAGVDASADHLGGDGHLLFFSADSGANGSELWASDGTPGSAYQVLDIAPGALGSNPRYPIVFQGTLYFIADSSSQAAGLWKSDGTAGGTVEVKSFSKGPFYKTGAPLAVGGVFFFGADDGVHGEELWISDGTTAGTFMLKDLNIPGQSSSPRSLTRVGDKLYFFAQDVIPSSDAGLWESDGTATGTKFLGDIFHIDLVSEPAAPQVVVVGRRLVIQALAIFTSTYWTYDLDSPLTPPLKMSPEVKGFFGAGRMATCGERAYLGAALAGTQSLGYELLVSDGSVGGTSVVADIAPGSASSSPTDIVVCGPDLLLVAADANGDRQLYQLTEPGAHTVNLGYGAPGFDLSAGSPVLGAPLTIQIENPVPGTLSALFFGPPALPTANFIEPGSALWLNPLSASFATSSFAPTWTMTLQLAAAPAFVSAEVHFQAFSLPSGTPPFSASNGLRLTLGN